MGNDGEISINRLLGLLQTGRNLLTSFSLQFPGMLEQVCGLADLRVALLSSRVLGKQKQLR